MNISFKYIAPFVFGASLVMLGCGHSVPADSKYVDSLANVYPCYDGAAIPCNIAPLDFDIEDEADEYLTRIYSDKSEIFVEGSFVDIPEGDWNSMLNESKGDSLHIGIYEKHGDEWRRYRTMSVFVSPDTIDRYLVYRLIEPSYVTFEGLRIEQRDLTSFDTKTVYDNMAMSTGDNGQCVNCHSFQNYNAGGNMQMHFRVANGGTLVMHGDNIRKVNFMSGSAISTGVYPSWHPTKNLIAYSLNETGQNFHTRDIQKVEVLDYASDVILYDADKDVSTYVAHDSLEFETFPYWNHDGTKLYYCSAHFKFNTDDVDTEMADRYKEVKYNILSRDFNPDTNTFGQVDTVFNAASFGKSATFPRESPDGRYLLFTMADFGNFHIWHKSADLYVKDLRTGSVRPLREVNSNDVESYHSWSSSGRWIVFSSRRDDGSYTRPYIAWFDSKGNAHKPFVLPQGKSGFYKKLYKSFNIPVFIVSPVVQSSRAMAEVLKGEADVVPLNE